MPTTPPPQPTLTMQQLADAMFRATYALYNVTEDEGATITLHRLGVQIWWEIKIPDPDTEKYRDL
jgi:hypothetical protein